MLHDLVLNLGPSIDVEDGTDETETASFCFLGFTLAPVSHCTHSMSLEGS